MVMMMVSLHGDLSKALGRRDGALRRQSVNFAGQNEGLQCTVPDLKPSSQFPLKNITEETFYIRVLHHQIALVAPREQATIMFVISLDFRAESRAAISQL